MTTSDSRASQTVLRPAKDAGDGIETLDGAPMRLGRLASAMDKSRGARKGPRIATPSATKPRSAAAMPGDAGSEADAKSVAEGPAPDRVEAVPFHSARGLVDDAPARTQKPIVAAVASPAVFPGEAAAAPPGRGRLEAPPDLARLAHPAPSRSFPGVAVLAVPLALGVVIAGLWLVIAPRDIAEPSLAALPGPSEPAPSPEPSPPTAAPAEADASADAVPAAPAPGNATEPAAQDATEEALAQPPASAPNLDLAAIRPAPRPGTDVQQPATATLALSDGADLRPEDNAPRVAEAQPSVADVARTQPQALDAAAAPSALPDPVRPPEAEAPGPAADAAAVADTAPQSPDIAASIETALIEANATRSTDVSADGSVWGGPHRIVIHFRGSDGARIAVAAETRLRDAGAATIEMAEIGFDISTSNVRFYFPEDRSKGEAIVEAFADVDPHTTLRDFADYRPQPLPGLVELWIASP